MDILIGAHSAQNISYDVIIKLLNIALERIDGIGQSSVRKLRGGEISISWILNPLMWSPYGL